MEFYDLLIQYAVLPITIICWGLGYVIKHYIKKIPNNYITVILPIVGLLLSLAFNSFTFTFDIVLTGIGSGLLATGSYEAIRNFFNNKQNEEEIKE